MIKGGVVLKPPATLEEIFSQADQDENGNLDRSEFFDAVAKNENFQFVVRGITGTFLGLNVSILLNSPRSKGHSDILLCSHAAKTNIVLGPL